MGLIETSLNLVSIAICFGLLSLIAGVFVCAYKKPSKRSIGVATICFLTVYTLLTTVLFLRGDVATFRAQVLRYQSVRRSAALMTDGNATTPAYDEATIVHRMADLYKILIRLGHWEDDDIAWPPPEGHNMTGALSWPLMQLEPLDPRVVSLMQHLPVLSVEHFRAKDYREMAPRMLPLDYRNGLRLHYSRCISMLLGDDEDCDLPSTAFTLLVGEDQQLSPHLVLDVSDNSIRYYAGNTDELDDEYTRNEPNDDKVIEYSNRVENWPAESAPKYLEGMIRRYEEGELLPDTFCGIIEVDPKGSDWKAELRRILMEEYGWPEYFKERAWKQNSRGIVERLMEEDDPRNKQVISDRRMAESNLRDTLGEYVNICSFWLTPEEIQKVKGWRTIKFDDIAEDGHIVDQDQAPMLDEDDA